MSNDNKTIPELTAGSVINGTLFETAQPDSSAAGYASTKVTSDAVGTYVNTTETYSSLTTTSKTTVGAINEVDAKTAADIPYSAGVSVADKLDSLSYIESTSVDSVTGVTWTCKKYNNGELEIYGSKYYTPPTNISFNAWGSLYVTVFNVGTYPIAFYAPPTVIGQAQIENVGCLSSTQATSNTTTAPQITCVRGIAGTIDTSFHINLGLYAHGRWKA